MLIFQIIKYSFGRFFPIIDFIKLLKISTWVGATTLKILCQTFVTSLKQPSGFFSYIKAAQTISEAVTTEVAHSTLHLAFDSSCVPLFFLSHLNSHPGGSVRNDCWYKKGYTMT